MNTGPRYHLRFPETAIESWASRYPAAYDAVVENQIAPSAKTRGYLTRSEFLTLCRWKSPRTQPRCEENAEDFVTEITRTAFSATHERIRIEMLTLLRGVAWPTASVLLHFACLDPYPIVDFRTLWSLGIKAPPEIDFPQWWAYTVYCRALAKRNNVSMRILDRALWQYSATNQKASRK